MKTRPKVNPRLVNPSLEDADFLCTVFGPLPKRFDHVLGDLQLLLLALVVDLESI
jgi:hypothetical protein